MRDTRKFSERLKQLREATGLSKRQFVARFNEQFDVELTRAAVSLYETGKRQPNFSILDMLAEFFNVSTDYLLGRVDEREPYGVIGGDNAEAGGQMQQALRKRMMDRRSELGLSQEELAQRAHCKPGDIWEVEDGGAIHSLATGRQIARALGVSLDYLIGRTNDPRPLEDRVSGNWREIRSISGERLRGVRRDKGVAIEELAAWVGVSAEFINKVENGKAMLPLWALKEVCEYLGVSRTYILTHSDEERPGGTKEEFLAKADDWEDYEPDWFGDLREDDEVRHLLDRPEIKVMLLRTVDWAQYADRRVLRDIIKYAAWRLDQEKERAAIESRNNRLESNRELIESVLDEAEALSEEQRTEIWSLMEQLVMGKGDLEEAATRFLECLSEHKEGSLYALLGLLDEIASKDARKALFPNRFADTPRALPSDDERETGTDTA